MAARSAGAAAQPRAWVAALMALPENNSEYQTWFAVFVQEFARLGWVDGRNVRIDQRWTISVDQARIFAKELIELRPDAVLAVGTPATGGAAIRDAHDFRRVRGCV